MAGIAIYPGTFDPVTRGHIDIVRRALKMFDHVVIGVADSPAKQPFFNLDERLDMLQTVFAEDDKVKVRPFSGLLIDFARDNNATIIVRGLRAISDFEYEVQLAGMNRSLAPEIETVFPDRGAALCLCFVQSRTRDRASRRRCVGVSAPGNSAAPRRQAAGAKISGGDRSWR